MPASAGEVALEPVFPLFSSGKTVKALRGAEGITARIKNVEQNPYNYNCPR